MKHLLIGGAGFLGRHLASELLARGDEVGIYDNYSFSEPLELTHPNLKMMVADAVNDTSISSALFSFEPDMVVWLPYFFSYEPSNIPHVRHSWLMHGMVKTMQCIAETRERGSTRFIYVSSDMVYRSASTFIRENAVTDWTNQNTFVTNKLIAETYVITTCRNLKVPWTILRPSILVGDRDHLHAMADPLSYMIFTMLVGRGLVVKHSQQQRDYLLVDQAAEIIANILQSKDPKGIYNVSSCRGLSNAELIQRLIPIIQPQVLPKVLESKEGNLVLDNSKIMALGKVEIVDFVDKLSDIVEYRKAQMTEE